MVQDAETRAYGKEIAHVQSSIISIYKDIYGEKSCNTLDIESMRSI